MNYGQNLAVADSNLKEQARVLRFIERYRRWKMRNKRSPHTGRHKTIGVMPDPGYVKTAHKCVARRR